MNLLTALSLEGAKTTEVRLVPTSRFFKPVLTLSAPLKRADAELLNCGYLYDDSGNPREFEGTHRLAGELAEAELTLSGNVVGDIVLKTEKVAHLSCYREEKVGMKIMLRAHLGESEDTLLALLQFLSKLNKDPFSLTVRAAQRSLLEIIEDGEGPGHDPNFKFPAPNDEGEYSIEEAARRPVTAKHGEANIQVMEVDGGHICGWSVNWKHKLAGGERLTTSRPVCASERAALELGCREAYEFLKTITPEGKGERESKSKIIASLVDMYPGLARESAREAAIAD